MSYKEIQDGMRSETLKKFQMTDHGAKKPSSSFFIWKNENRDAITAAHPNLTIAEFSKECGLQWGNLSTEVKKIYEDKAKEEKM